MASRKGSNGLTEHDALGMLRPAGATSTSASFTRGGLFPVSWLGAGIRVRIRGGSSHIESRSPEGGSALTKLHRFSRSDPKPNLDDSTGKSTLADTLGLLIVLLASFPTIQPLLPKGMPGSHDGEGHLFGLLDFDLTVRAGFFDPRLAPHLALNFGYASFTFYAPASLYLAETFRLFGLGSIAAFKAFLALSLLLSAIGMYLLGRDLYDRRAAVVAALVYVYLPYHLLDVYTRADVGEILGLALLPFVVWSLRRVARRPRPDTIAVAALFAAGLVVSHNLTALLVAPVVALLALAAWPRTRSGLFGLGAVAVLAALLSAFYWLPVFSQIGTIDTTALTSKFFDYHLRFTPVAHLVQWTWVYNYDYNPGSDALFNLGRAQTVLLVVAVVWVALVRPRGWRLALSCAAAILLLVWLEQAGSVVVWDHFPMAKFIQFPYRLSVNVTLCSAILLAAPAAGRADPIDVLGRWRATSVRSGLALALILLAVLAGASLLGLPRTRTDLSEARVNLPMLWRLEADRQLIAASTQGDYLPLSIPNPFFPVAVAPKPPTGPGADAGASATLLQASLDGLTARVDASRPSALTFDWFAYPAWHATLDGQPLAIHAIPPLELLQVDLPAGSHVLRLDASGGPGDRPGLVLTGLGLLVVLGLAGSSLLRRGWRVGLEVGLGAAVLVGAGIVLVAVQVQPAVALDGATDFRQGSELPVRLVGAVWNPNVRTPDGVVDVTLFWEALRAPLPDCTVNLRVLDASGAVVGARDKVPLFGLRPCATWQPGEIARDEEQIRLNPGVASGTYRLAVGLTLGGEALAPATPTGVVRWPAKPGGAEMSGVVLGALPFPRPPPLPAPAALAAPGSWPIGVTLGTSLRLETAAILPPGNVPPGDKRFVARLAPNGALRLQLVWRALGDVSADYSVFTHLTDASGRLAAQDDAWPDRFDDPTSVWFPGDARVDRYKLVPSNRLAPGVYTLTTGMYLRPSLARLKVQDAPDGPDEIALGRVKVSAPDQVFGTPRPVSPRDDLFGGQIRLIGAAIHLPSGADQPLLVDLSWRALARPTDDDIVFVHVVGPDGQLVAQHDGPPLDGQLPTTDWDPGDTIDDRIAVPLPANLAPGSYHIELGLYHAKDQIRLSLPDGTTAVGLLG